MKDLIPTPAPATIADFQDGVAAVAELDTAEQAYAWLKIVRKALADPARSGDPALPVFAQAQWVLAWVALPMLRLVEAVEMLQSHVREALEFKVQIPQKLRMTLATEMLHDLRDDWKRKMREALFANTEVITQPVNDPEGQMLSSVSDWLKRYFRSTVDQPPVAKAQFWNSAILTKLTADDRSALRTIIEVFEFLFLSSLTPQGIEEPITIDDEKGRRVMRAGVIERIVDDSRAHSAMESLTDEQLGPSASSIHFVTRALHGGLMVGSDLREDEWEAAREYANELGDWERFSYERRRERLTVDDVEIILRAWFERKEGRSEQDAIRCALTVAKAIKHFGYPEFIDIAYYDAEEKRFHWKDI